MTIKGNRKQLKKIDKLFHQLLLKLRAGQRLHRGEVESLISLIKDNINNGDEGTAEAICVTFKGKNIIPKNSSQKKYVEAIRKYDLVFSIGPAGTG
ncbi:MAG: PhoH family protein, partial [bacterium]